MITHGFVLADPPPAELTLYKLGAPSAYYRCPCGWSLLVGLCTDQPLTIGLVGYMNSKFVGGKVFKPVPRHLWQATVDQIGKQVCPGQHHAAKLS